MLDQSVIATVPAASHSAAPAPLITREQLCGESPLPAACKETVGRSFGSYWLPPTPAWPNRVTRETNWTVERKNSDNTGPLQGQQSPACCKEDTTSLPLLAQASHYRSFSRHASDTLSFPVCVHAYNSSKHLLQLCGRLERWYPTVYYSYCYNKMHFLLHSLLRIKRKGSITWSVQFNRNVLLPVTAYKLSIA
jgi:hypothetical protein